MLDTTFMLLRRSALSTSSTIATRAPKKSKSKKTKVKIGGGEIANWELALIIIGSIIAALLIAYAAWWIYKRQKAKKEGTGKVGLMEDEEAFQPGVNGPSERASLEYGGGGEGVGKYEDRRRDE